jgi:hypothetical protein
MSMPFVFLMAWMACVVTCTETSADHENQNSLWVTKSDAEAEIVETSHCLENCFLTSPVTIQERQTFDTPILSDGRVFLPPSRSLVSISSVPASDINQNSPPEISPPIYLLLCNFRI